MHKICYVASSGGHLEEILALEPLGKLYSSVLITEKTSFNLSMWPQKIYSVSSVDRKDKLLFLKLFWISCVALFVFIKEKPDIILTTGALIAYPVCLLARFMKKKIIYIEILARVYSGSATGLRIYRFADLFIIQWENLFKIYPNAMYTGRLA